MRYFWRWVERIRNLVTPGRQDSSVQDEMQFHIDMEIRQHVAEGLSPEEARRLAMREFGGFERHREAVREARWASFPHPERGCRNSVCSCPGTVRESATASVWAS